MPAKKSPKKAPAKKAPAKKATVKKAASRAALASFAAQGGLERSAVQAHQEAVAEPRRRTKSTRTAKTDRSAYAETYKLALFLPAALINKLKAAAMAQGKTPSRFVGDIVENL